MLGLGLSEGNYLDIWTKFGVDPKYRQKYSLSGQVNLFPDLDKKSQDLTFGTDLEAIWNIQIFGYLDK